MATDSSFNSPMNPAWKGDKKKKNRGQVVKSSISTELRNNDSS